VAGENVFVATSEEGLIVLDRFRESIGWKLEPLPHAAPGPFRFRLSGPQGASGRIQRSSDLQSWSDWQPFSLTTPTLDFLDQRDRDMPVRYYRAVSP
jgi:hypothetical protein